MYAALTSTKVDIWKCVFFLFVKNTCGDDVSRFEPVTWSRWDSLTKAT